MSSTILETPEAKGCAHCGREVSAQHLRPDEPAFCCRGCRLVYNTIRGLGLDQFYDYRTVSDAASPLQEELAPESYLDLDSEDYAQAHIRQTPDGLSLVRFHLAGIHCAGCIWLVEKLPFILEGVVRSRLSFESAVVEVAYRANAVTPSRIARMLHSLGYPPTTLEDEHTPNSAGEDRDLLLRLGIAGFCASNTMMLAVSLFQGWFTGMEETYAQYFRWMSLLLTVPCVTYSALPFYRSAVAGLRGGIIHVDLPVTIALLAAFAVSVRNTIIGGSHVYYDTVCGLTFLLLSGRYLLARTMRRVRGELRMSWSLLPRTVLRVRGEEIRRVPVVDLKIGDRIEIGADERMPADAVLLEGPGLFDRSIITGEAEPVRAAPGDTIDAGTMNLESPIRAEVSRLLPHTRVGSLLNDIASGKSDRARISLLIDRVGMWFVFGVLCLATLVCAYWWPRDPESALTRTLALLIVSCPCAFAFGAPLAFAASIARAAKKGILIRGPDVLELVHRVRSVYIDKTGTLTAGKLSVTDVRSFTGAPEIDELRRYAYALASTTPRHPVAKAVAEHCSSAAPESPFGLAGVRALQGRGICGALPDGRSVYLGSKRMLNEFGIAVGDDAAAYADTATGAGKTVVFLGIGTEVAAAFALRDTLAPESRAFVEMMRNSSRRCAVLSGDNQRTVDAVASELGIRHSHAEKLPEDKEAIVAADTQPCAMVGDGVNDARAMRAADVGVAVGNGVPSHMDIADVVIVSGGIGSAAELFEGSRRTMLNIYCVLLFSFLYNAGAMYLAATGRMDPLVAAVLMPASSLAVIGISRFSTAFREA